MESKLVRDESISILAEFEACDDLLGWGNTHPMTRSHRMSKSPANQ